jgi:hypothetical protein
MREREQRRAARSEDRTWVVALVLLCLGILGFGVFYSTNTISDPARLASEYLVYAVPLWVVFYAVFLQKRGVTVCGIAFTLIFAALFAGGLIAASPEKQQARDALASVQAEISRAMGASVDSRVLPERAEEGPAAMPQRAEGGPAAMPQRAEGGPAAMPQPRNVSGGLEGLMKEFINRIDSQQRDYVLELEAIGWTSVLDVQRIEKDVTLAESKTIVKRAKAIVDKYEQETADLLQNTRASVNSLDMPESPKEEMLASYDRSMGKASQQMSEQWKLERQVVLEVEKIFVLLAASKSWVIKGGSIVFNNEELARYNAHIENIQQMAQQQQQAQKESYAEVSRYLESLRNAPK